MNKDLLKENRIHGDTEFPFGIYTKEINRGEILFDYHWHEEIEILMITQGKAMVRTDAGCFEVSVGQAVFINSGEIHNAYSADSAPCTYYALVFNPVLLSGDTQNAIKSKYIDPLIEKAFVYPVYIKSDSLWGREILSELDEILKLCSTRPFALELTIKARLCMIFSIILSRCEPVYNKNKAATDKLLKLKKVMKYIQTNYSSKISLQQLAAQANMSEGHFCRFFKQQVKLTPIAYINYYRILKAASLLELEDKKILEISMETGFEYFSYFILIFKQYMKCTPSEYRKKTHAGITDSSARHILEGPFRGKPQEFRIET